MTFSLKRIPEWRNVDKKKFRDEIVPQNRPAVLKGLVKDWPSVREGMKSPIALAAYIKRFDQGRLAKTAIGAASIKGRFFYAGEDLLKLNFSFRQDQISTTLDWLIEHQADENPMAVAVQNTPLPEYLPKFTDENDTDLPHKSAVPRIWIGNAVTVSTHFDRDYNIACVVGGHRRFTLFPPEQLPNLYVGPFLKTPAGAPVSMVSLEEPDLTRYPRFEQALAAAVEAELEPGDAMYIPYFWWHHIKSLDVFNVLVNYWWNETEAPLSSPGQCLLHGLLTLRNLPPDQRAVWRMVFDHFVFQTNGIDPVAHLDPRYQGLFGPLTQEVVKELQDILLRKLRG